MFTEYWKKAYPTQQTVQMQSSVPELTHNEQSAMWYVAAGICD